MDAPLQLAHGRLQELEALVARRDRLTADARRISKRLARLEERAEHEDADVRAIERGGFVELMKNLVEPREERLTREREEAFRAALARDRVRAELAEVRGELATLESQVAELPAAREEYRRLLAERERSLANVVGPIGEELTRLAHESEELAARRAARAPMLASAREARYELSSIAGAMERAVESTRSDAVGIPFSRGAKYQHVELASRRLGLAQTALRRFAQLSGRAVSTRGIRFDVPDSLRFADGWGRNDFAADLAILSHLSGKLERVRHLEREVIDAARELEREDEADAGRETEIAAHREELLRAAGAP